MSHICNENESGRSMVEMLGVLAIIGVLSVGGIAGYSKAMLKYRINKTISDVTFIAGNVRAFFATQKGFSGLNSGTAAGISLLKKANILPQDIISDELQTCPYVADHKSYLLNAWGDVMRVVAYNSSSFVISLHSIPTSACIELATHDWQTANVPVIYINNSFHQTTGAAVNYTLATPADMASVIQACSSDDNFSDLVLYFYEDVSNSSRPSNLSTWSSDISG